jgi:hypothetical protein
MKFFFQIRFCSLSYLIALQMQENQYATDDGSAHSSPSYQRQQPNRRSDMNQRAQDRRESKRKSSVSFYLFFSNKTLI